MAPSTSTTKEDKNDILKAQRKLIFNNIDENFNPIVNFLIALKAP